MIRVVVLIRVGGERAQPDGDAGGLEVGRVESNDSDDIVVIWLEVLYGDGRLLGRYVADWCLLALLACLAHVHPLSMPLIRMTYFNTDRR